MKFHVSLACLLLPGLILADSTTTQCLTKTGSKSLKSCPTASASTTYTNSCHGTVTIHPTTTVTKYGSTTTIINTSVSTTTTTASQLTDTVTETSIETDSTTVAAPTFTSTSTETDTSTTTTTVISFLPIQSTLPGASQVGTSGKVKRSPRGQSRWPVSKREGDIYARANPATSPKKGYCQQVTCTRIVWVTKTTFTTKTGSTVTQTQTLVSTATTTTVVVVTQTSVPGDASTTTTTTSTITNTATTTPSTEITVTTTITATATATNSAECNADNFVNMDQGYDIIGANPTNNYQTYTVLTNIGPTNMQDCCESCVGNPVCEVFQFTTPSNGGCTIVINNSGTCSFGESTWSALLDPTPGHTATLGNGNCGVVNSYYVG